MNICLVSCSRQRRVNGTEWVGWVIGYLSLPLATPSGATVFQGPKSPALMLDQFEPRLASAQAFRVPLSRRGFCSHQRRLPRTSNTAIEITRATGKPD
jgi:hypothetical protein